MTILSSNALQIANKRYFGDNEDWQGLSIRCGTENARVEKDKSYSDLFSEIIYNMEFIPAGRILRNSGRHRGSLFNCYVTPCYDSIEEIGQWVKDCFIIWSEGGGIGTNMSFLRPQGAPILGKGGEASGPISYLKAGDAAAACIESGGQRRAAGMAMMNVSHPNIFEFINAKIVDKILSYFNISVGVNETFLDAVERNINFDLTFNHKKYNTVQARSIWDLILKNMIKHAEPGLLNWNKMRSNNSYYFAPIQCVNPCIIGDTMIAVADGRNAISIKQLAEEKKDVPVYSCNPVTGRTEIKYGRNPRKTGIKKEVWKLILDDGSELIATPDHKILTKTQGYKELKDLIPGESLVPFNSYEVHHGYRNIKNSGLKRNVSYRSRRQYRLIYEFHNGTDYLGKELAIHHKDFNNQNDCHTNLESMPIIEHNKLHSEKMKGKNNPYHCMSDEWKKNFATHNGEKNGRWGGYSNDKLIELGKKLFKKYGKFTQKIWYGFTKKHKISHKIEAKGRFGSWSNFKSLVVDNHKVVSVKFYGYEDVYNITVDDNHNYNIITSNIDDKYITSSGICVKNCGEAVLEPYGICCLGSIVLPKFISNVNTNWKRMGEVLRLAVRFLDNIIDINKYILPQFDKTAHDGRRIGVGIMGLAEYLFAKKIRYGSEKAIQEIEHLMKFMRNTVYEESIKIASEKGSFTKFDPYEYGKAHFIRTLSPLMRKDIKKHGIRNVTLMAIAPTGTTSLLPNPQITSSGEPLPAKAFKRSDRVSERYYIHPMFEKLIKEGYTINNMPNWFVDSFDLKPEDHLNTQVAIQKYVDGAVSKTINLPKGTNEEELSELLLEYIHDLKGVTVYVDESREDQPIKKMAVDEAVKEILAGNETSSNLDASEVACKSGKCEI